MEHEYLAAYHDESDEPVAEELDLDEGLETTNIDDWRRLIWDEIEDFAVSVCSLKKNNMLFVKA